MSWHNTSWGLVCAQLHAYLLPEFAGLVLGIGPDDLARHDATQRILFLGPGMVVQYQTLDLVVPDETLVPTIRGSSATHRGIVDRICPILCIIATPFNGTESTADTSPVVCEDIYERFLSAINTKAHIRASDVESAKWFGSRAGMKGSAVHVSFSLRFTVYDKPLVTAKPTSTTVTTVDITDPAGVIVNTAVPGG
jgi:hypothetical protein